MVRLNLRVLAAVAVVSGVASFSLPAHAEEQNEAANKVPPAASIGQVSAVSLANVAGLLNYCLMTDLVSHEDGDSVQTAINTKTNAVPEDQSGNFDYAYGSAGQFHINDKATTLTSLEQDVQGKICSAVLARAKSSI